MQIAPILASGTGRIHGLDSSTAMIESAKKAAQVDTSASQVCTFEGMKLFSEKKTWPETKHERESMS